MKPTTTREAAYVQTYIKDNSLIKNAPDFAGLFACVTPWGPKPKADSDEIVYEPVFIQDTDTLDRVFGDPRIDPEKYRDLYAVREIVRTGFSVYISKVPSGDPAEFLCLLNDASKKDTSTETMRTDEDGVLLIDGHTKLSDITNGNGIPVLGFETAFGTIDEVAKKELDSTNTISMRRMGAFGNNIAVKVSRESTMQDGVETGSIYTVHVGEKVSDGYKEVENLASSGDTVANAFDSNTVVSGSFDKSDEELLTAMSDWTALEGGVGNYHGIWKIGDLAKLRNLYGIDDSSPAYEIITYWFNSAGCGEFIFVPFPASEPDIDIADAFGKLSAMGASKKSIIAIDTTDTDWYSQTEVKNAIEDNDYVVILSRVATGSDTPGALAPVDMFATYPSSVKMASTNTKFGMNIALACAINQKRNPVDASVKTDDMLGRFLPGIVPCTLSGVEVLYDATKYEDAKTNNLITFAPTGSGETRLYVANSPVSCTYMVDGIDYKVETVMVDGEIKTKVTFQKQKNSEGDEIPYTDGLEVSVEHTAATKPYADVVSSITDELYLMTALIQLKPKSLGLYAMDVRLYSHYDAANPDQNVIVSTRVSLAEGLSNGAFMESLNSVLGSYLSFNLMEPYEAEGTDVVETLRAVVKSGHTCGDPIILSQGKMSFSVGDYQRAFEEFKNPAYNGCFISELSAMVTDADGNIVHLPETTDESPRRVLHYYLKQIAADRKDLTCVFTTPYGLSLDDACNWVNSLDRYSDLWEYGVSEPVTYVEQSFYCEMYWDWVRVTCQKLNNGVISKTVRVDMSPCYLVIMRGLASYRTRGTFYPVAGEQGGKLPDGVAVIRNPSTKTERNKLINHRINPIFDLGVLGVQIYGNETLNYKYTDLSAAHIARTLVYIHQQVDRYTNTLTFSLNDRSLWQKWKQYVSSNILDPIYALGGLAQYSVAMGFDTTSPELIAQRKINGVIHLQFVPDAEIFTVDFIVDSSANTVESGAI